MAIRKHKHPPKAERFLDAQGNDKTAKLAYELNKRMREPFENTYRYRRAIPNEQRTVNSLVTQEQYKKMWDAQDGKCAICGYAPKDDERRLCVDHDHRTGDPRALLCGHCNSGLGLLADDPDRCRKAAEYLERYWQPVKW